MLCFIVCCMRVSHVSINVLTYLLTLTVMFPISGYVVVWDCKWTQNDNVYHWHETEIAATQYQRKKRLVCYSNKKEQRSATAVSVCHETDAANTDEPSCPLSVAIICFTARLEENGCVGGRQRREPKQHIFCYLLNTIHDALYTNGRKNVPLLFRR